MGAPRRTLRRLAGIVTFVVVVPAGLIGGLAGLAGVQAVMASLASGINDFSVAIPGRVAVLAVTVTAAAAAVVFGGSLRHRLRPARR